MEKELRRYQSTLYSTGLGVMAFGLWSVLKTIMYAVLVPESFGSLLKADDEFSRIAAIVVFSVLGVIILADLGLRVLVGRTAMRVGKDTRKDGVFYLVVTVWLMLWSVFSLAFSLIAVFNNATTIPSVAASILIEVTQLITMTELIVSAVKVRKLKKELEAA